MLHIHLFDEIFNSNALTFWTWEREMLRWFLIRQMFFVSCSNVDWKCMSLGKVIMILNRSPFSPSCSLVCAISPYFLIKNALNGKDLSPLMEAPVGSHHPLIHLYPYFSNDVNLDDVYKKSPKKIGHKKKLFWWTFRVKETI